MAVHSYSLGCSGDKNITSSRSVSALIKHHISKNQNKHPPTHTFFTARVGGPSVSALKRRPCFLALKELPSQWLPAHPSSSRPHGLSVGWSTLHSKALCLLFSVHSVHPSLPQSWLLLIPETWLKWHILGPCLIPLNCHNAHLNLYQSLKQGPCLLAVWMTSGTL